jgi:hypothetical protein
MHKTNSDSDNLSSTVDQQPSPQVFDEVAITKPKLGAWKIMLPIFILLIVCGYAVYHYHVNLKAAAVGAVLVGFYSGFIGWLLGVIALIPFVGPIVVKVLTMSFIWVLNGVGYLVSYVAIRRGYSKDVIAYRGITIALLVGIVIGYVIAQFI